MCVEECVEICAIAKTLFRDSGLVVSIIIVYLYVRSARGEGVG